MKALLYAICLCITANANSYDKPRSFKLDDFNYARTEYARDLKIADMNILTWSDDLKKKAEGLECDATHGSDYRVFLSPDYTDKAVRKLSKALNTDNFLMMVDSKNLYFYEMLLPQQRFIGCYPKKCPTQHKFPNGTTVNYDSRDICVMGPHGNIEKPQIGPPGSKCGSAGKSQGMCIDSGSSNSASSSQNDGGSESSSSSSYSKPSPVISLISTVLVILFASLD